MMNEAKIILDRDYVIGEVDQRIYGSFIEHLGRAVYGGIYEPGHPQADEKGFRKDVLALIKGMGVPLIRYPGGNFVSGFNWEDSIGPVAERPSKLDLAWFTTETNEVGLHEFYNWAKSANSEIMYAVNLGTRGPDSARNLVEYANHKGGSRYSDLRIQNGQKEPFNIKLWCLGNEMDNPVQMCQKTAYEYGRIANETAKMMKWVDPSIELAACGSTSFVLPTFGDWELTVLEECYDNIDYVSLHRYYENDNHNTPEFLARTMDMEDFIQSVISICDAIKGKKHSRKRLNLSFDEWNVWYHSKDQDIEVWKRDKWNRALPLLEEKYNFEDALLVGDMLITLLKHADRVKIACLAQLVNVIAPIMTRNNGGCWAQTIYYPFMHASKYGRGCALRTIVNCPVYDCKDYEKVPMISAVATVDDGGNVTVFCVNKDIENAYHIAMDLRSFGEMILKERIVLHHSDVNAMNTEENPYCVSPVTMDEDKLVKGIADLQVEPLSWNVFRLIRP